MNFLTEDQRTKAIESLKRAPDEVLLSAMVDFRRFRHIEEGTRANFNQVVDELTERRTHNEPVAEDHRGSGINVQPVEEIKLERINVSPGTPSITKIGSNTKEYIINELKISGAPRTLEHFGMKYKEHLKLLWARGEIKFDGTEYYL